MTTVSGINNGMSNLSQLGQTSSSPTTRAGGADGDGDNDGGGAKRVRGGGRSSFISAINQALSQIGVAGTSDSSSAAAGSSSTSTQDPQAIRTFMHDLFAAMRSQGSGQQTAPASGTDSDGDNDNSGVAGVTGTSRRGYGVGGIENKLQSLIQQLSSASPSASGSDSIGTTSPNNSALTTLQQDFQNLMNAQGASGSQATLGSFLQTLVQNLHNANPAGNIVSTQA